MVHHIICRDCSRATSNRPTYKTHCTGKADWLWKGHVHTPQCMLHTGDSSTLRLHSMTPRESDVLVYKSKRIIHSNEAESNSKGLPLKVTCFSDVPIILNVVFSASGLKLLIVESKTCHFMC